MSRTKMTRRSSPQKVLSKTLYTYVRPVNDKWVRARARRAKMAYSTFLDHILTSLRTKRATKELRKSA